MSETLNQAEELRQKAIVLLVAERQAIDEKLALFGFDGAGAAPKKNKCSKCGQEGHTARNCSAVPSAAVE
jgi:hypothetical protein